MIDHVWSILCSKSIIDSRSNNISLLDVLEQLNLGPDVRFPVNIMVPFELVTLWSRADFNKPSKGQSLVTVRSPSGDSSILGRFDIDLTDDTLRFRQGLVIQGLPITEAGKYTFEVELIDDGAGGGPRVVARIPLEVRIEEGPGRPDRSNSS